MRASPSSDTGSSYPHQLTKHFGSQGEKNGGSLDGMLGHILLKKKVPTQCAPHLRAEPTRPVPTLKRPLASGPCEAATGECSRNYLSQLQLQLQKISLMVIKLPSPIFNPATEFASVTSHSSELYK